jgi:predicted esterase
MRAFLHGTEDRVVEYDAGLEAREVLEGFGYEVTLFDFQGGHRVPSGGLRALQDWMD